MTKIIKLQAKEVESLRHKHGGSHIVRILHTKPFIDDKWINLCDLNRDNIKNYLVVRYPSEQEVYIPTWNKSKEKKVIWWDQVTHNKIKKEIREYDDKWERHIKNQSKNKKASQLFANAEAEYITTDDFKVAQDKYLEWLDDLGIIEKKLYAGNKIKK